MEKCCVRCGVNKALAEFTPHKGQPLGVASYCKPCNAEYSRRRRVDPAVRSAYAAKQRERRKDAQVQARDRQTSRAWKAANPERAAALSNKPEKRKKDREWRKSERGRLSTLMATYRRAALTAEGDLSASDWLEILEAFQHRCGYCLAEGPLELEHVHPLSRGGRHTRENVVPACRSCNSRKNARPLLRALMTGAI